MLSSLLEAAIAQLVKYSITITNYNVSHTHQTFEFFIKSFEFHETCKGSLLLLKPNDI